VISQRNSVGRGLSRKSRAADGLVPKRLAKTEEEEDRLDRLGLTESIRGVRIILDREIWEPNNFRAGQETRESRHGSLSSPLAKSC